MNDKHAVISNLGGKCVVMEWVPSMIMPGAKELSYQSFTSFRERYANQWVDHGRRSWAGEQSCLLANPPTAAAIRRPRLSPEWPQPSCREAT